MSEPGSEWQIVRGEPTDEELAALTALIAAAGSESTTSDAPAPVTRGRWNDPALRVRRTWAVGPGGWRAAR
jgi:Acyl-CoA carboxylase epsilon subunit